MSPMSTPLKVTYIGNFEPPHSTENHIARALEVNGHGVARIQENRAGAFNNAALLAADCDLILWTRTGWPWDRVYGSAQGSEMAHDEQRRMLRIARAIGTPVVGYHLDLWFGLNREHQLDEPFFESDIVITADGGHQAEFEARGIEHVWFPPGVSRPECEPGMFRSEFHSKLAFVGNWQGDYHKEHQHRFELVDWLRRNFRRDCAFYPLPGQHAVRGNELRDLYASVEVVIGDSCFAGTGPGYYWSDRIPETLGRGGYLIHPHVVGIDAHFTPSPNPDAHMAMWDAGDWNSLAEEIEWALTNPAERKNIARNGREHVLRRHTYEVRMVELVDLLQERNLL